MKTARESEDRAVVEVIVRKETGLPGPLERQLELLMSSCCESVILTYLHPHTAISVSILIHNDQGSVSIINPYLLHVGGIHDSISI